MLSVEYKKYLIKKLFQAYIVLNNESLEEKNLREALKVIDMGLLLGAPLINNHKLLLKTASLLTQIINEFSPPNQLVNDETKKRKLTNFEYQHNSKIIESIERPSIEKFNKDCFLPQIPIKLLGILFKCYVLNKI